MKSRSKKEKVTTDDLAGMMARGFSELNTRMGNLEEKVDGVEEKMDYRFNVLSNRLDHMYSSKTDLSEHGLLVTRIEKIERKLSIKR